jgi:hypothetical protein
LLDLHKEAGPLSVTLPETDGELSFFVQTPSASGSKSTVTEQHVRAGTELIELDTSGEEPPRLAERGASLLGNWFGSPYGPAAYASYLARTGAEPQAVFGISQDDVQRMSNYLTALSDVDRSQRRAAALGMGASGLILAGTAVAGRFADPKMDNGVALGLGAVGAAFVGGGLWYGLSDGPGERARATFEAELRSAHGSSALALAHTEDRLREVASAERARRQFTFWLFQGLALGMATLTTIGVVSDHDLQPGTYGLLYGSSALVSGLGFFVLSVETPTERLLRLYHDDPGIRLRAGVSAVPGGVGLGLSGSF